MKIGLTEARIQVSVVAFTCHRSVNQGRGLA